MEPIKGNSFGGTSQIMEASCKTSKRNASKKQALGQQISISNPKFKIGQVGMVKNHACHTFELKYLLDYRALKILNDSTLLLLTSNGKEKKTNINNVKPCSSLEILEIAWDSILAL